MLNIYFGRESLDKEKFIFENLSGRSIILVPDQYTLEAERAAFRHLGVSALMDVEVLSPSRLGSRVLAYTGGGRRPYIDKYGRHMLLYRSARRLADKLQVFKGLEKKNSFLAAVNDFISEMKQYDCGPCDLQNAMAQCEEGSYTQRKLADICLCVPDLEDVRRVGAFESLQTSLLMGWLLYLGVIREDFKRIEIQLVKTRKMVEGLKEKIE